jgi:prolyl 4-hydroxylase
LAKLLSDYIKIYERTLSPERCQALIDRFEAAPELHERKVEDGSYSFMQLSVSRHWKDVEAEIGQIIIGCIRQYWKSLEIGPFWPAKPVSEELRLKRYLPDGRDSFPPHVDVMDDSNSRRLVTAILYLNDPGGGETVFPDLDISVPPAAGRLAVFPPLWLFPHAGMPPRDRAKYILHAYLWYPPGSQAERQI